MAKVLKINKGVEEGVKEVLKFLLENERVKGVFTLRKTGRNGAVTYALIKDPSEIDNCLPLYPLMPINAAKSLSTLTLREPLSESLALFVRPCELRAFVELVKLQQGSLENMLILSSTCGGVYPLKMAVTSNTDRNLEKYWTSLRAIEIPSDIRPTCKGCEHFLPYNSDMTLVSIGKDIDKSCNVVLNTKKAEESLRGIEEEISDGELAAEDMESLRKRRISEREKLFSDLKTEDFGLDGLIDLHGKCIGCHGCSSVCPICYCRLCFFDSEVNEPGFSSYEGEMRKRGGIRVPPKTIFYHLGRLSHVGISCVGCGSCSDVCPVDIPLSTIFLKIGNAIQGTYGYLPGKDLDEKIPLQTFEEEELAKFEQ